MESILAKALPGLGQLAIKGWFTAMGIVGLLALFAVMIFGTPYDPGLIASGAVALMCFGFGETECRTFRTIVDHDPIYGVYKITQPYWRPTALGIGLHGVAVAALIFAIFRFFTSDTAEAASTLV